MNFWFIISMQCLAILTFLTFPAIIGFCLAWTRQPGSGSDGN